MTIFLDTSIIIDYLRQSDNPNSTLSQLSQKYSDYYISDITIAELYSGKFIWKSKKKMAKLKQLLSPITRYPTNKKICILAGKIRAKHNIALLDTIIAATAIYYQLPLATLNTKDFQDISNLKLVKL